jgi:primosomal protein N'
MRQAPELGEQVILFFNRRGSSSTVQCRNAATLLPAGGAVALSYHSAEESPFATSGLQRPVPEKCPACATN